MMADSIMVALLIIQISDIDLRIREAAIATKSADSALNLCGTKIPLKNKKLMNFFLETNTEENQTKILNRCQGQVHK